jgi:hypothetical protein
MNIKHLCEFPLYKNMYCTYCDFHAPNHSKYLKHLGTKKHANRYLDGIKEMENPNQNIVFSHVSNTTVQEKESKTEEKNDNFNVTNEHIPKKPKRKYQTKASLKEKILKENVQEKIYKVGDIVGSLGKNGEILYERVVNIENGKIIYEKYQPRKCQRRVKTASLKENVQENPINNVLEENSDEKVQENIVNEVLEENNEEKVQENPINKVLEENNEKVQENPINKVLEENNEKVQEDTLDQEFLDIYSMELFVYWMFPTIWLTPLNPVIEWIIRTFSMMSSLFGMDKKESKKDLSRNE